LILLQAYHLSIIALPKWVRARKKVSLVAKMLLQKTHISLIEQQSLKSWRQEKLFKNLYLRKKSNFLKTKAAQIKTLRKASKDHKKISNQFISTKPTFLQSLSIAILRQT